MDFKIEKIIEERICEKHDCYKQYLKLFRKHAIELKSKEAVACVDKEYYFRRKISKLQKQYNFLDIEWWGDEDVYTTWVYGGFHEEDQNDPYFDNHYCDSYEEAHERCLEYIKLQEVEA